MSTMSLGEPRCKDIDPGILPIVMLLRDAGIETSESCQGGDGHVEKYPFVSFYASRPEAFRALKVVFDAGLPVIELVQFWQVDRVDGEPHGPYWRLEFNSLEHRGEPSWWRPSAA